MIEERIKKDLKEALKQKDNLKSSVLRLLLSGILNKEKEKRYNLSKENPEIKKEDLERESKLTDEEIIDFIFSEIKKRKEAIEGYKKGKREDLAEKEEKEIEILKNYLPEQLSKEEIKQIVQQVIEELEVKDMKGMGKVMKEVIPKIKGRAEIGVVAEIVKEILS